MLLKLSGNSGNLVQRFFNIMKARSEWDEGEKKVVNTPLPFLRLTNAVRTPAREGQTLPVFPHSRRSLAIGMSPTGLQLSLQKRTQKKSADEEPSS